MSDTLVLPDAVVAERRAAVAAGLFDHYPAVHHLRSLAQRDWVAMLERLEDEANDAITGLPDVAPNPPRAVYLDRWRLALANQLGGPFDARLGSLVGA